MHFISWFIDSIVTLLYFACDSCCVLFSQGFYLMYVCALAILYQKAMPVNLVSQP